MRLYNDTLRTLGPIKSIINNLSTTTMSHSDISNMSELGLLMNLDEQKQVKELINRTITLGESNSALIIGPRGAGKSFLLQNVLNNLDQEGVLCKGIVVSLSGLLQTNDCLALREITRQLNVDGGTVCSFGSFAENFQNVLKTLQSGTKELSKPIVFILDEFDLFCHHKNQTLLYNLFDIAQSAQAPICVLGVTCRLDVIELLEKRVKSRFSHRQIFIFSHETFEEYFNLAQNLLKIRDAHTTELKVMKDWNSSIDKLFTEPEVSKALKGRFCLNRSARSLKSYLLLLMTKINKENPCLKTQHFKEISNFSSQDLKVHILQGLSVLQLSLIIAMKHLDSIYDGEPFNFEMVYDQYRKIGQKHSSMSAFERPVVLKAFDQLLCLELIRPIDQSRSCNQKEYKLMHMMVRPSQIDQALLSIPSLPTFLLHWSSSNVL